jgi:hypothetical protein
MTTSGGDSRSGEDQCIPLNITGKPVADYRKYIKLTLKHTPFKTGEGKNASNSPANAPSGSPVAADLSAMYDLYTVKDAPCQLLVSLPLARLYKKNSSSYEGLNSLRLETVDGGFVKIIDFSIAFSGYSDFSALLLC